MGGKGISNLALGEKIVEGVEVKVPKKPSLIPSAGLECRHCNVLISFMTFLTSVPTYHEN